ncbi:hypothetical protein Taro_042312 [Colocasia esculenta]|uniref:Uncharacterized protein n=1 Tax=Colocasia esculenta TaxID=4460 RepID=A0A843WW50_COLES|nr:hypothetical protein [Colocasia esculenta]
MRSRSHPCAALLPSAIRLLDVTEERRGEWCGWLAPDSSTSPSTCASAPPRPRLRPPFPSSPARPVPQIAAAASSPAMSAAAAAFVPTFISFDDDDFGEFEFAAAPASASPPPPSNHARSSQQQWQKTAGDEDDDWGDFVEGPIQAQPFGYPPPPPPSTSFFDPFPGPSATAPDPATVHPLPPVAADEGWKKPSGALPLSLFGEEDEEDGGGEELSNSLDPQISALKLGAFTSFKMEGSNGVASAQGEGLKDLIASLYGQANNVGPPSAGSNDGSGDNLKVHSSNGEKSNFPNGAEDEEDEFNENSWDFKDALDTPLEDSGDCVLVEKEDELAGVPRAKVKANDRGSGFQANGQKCNNMLGPNLPTRVLSDEGEWGNAFVCHDTTINCFEAGSADNGCNGSIPNAHHDFEHRTVEIGLSPSMVSGETSFDDSFWEFKDASSNSETMKHLAEPEELFISREEHTER